MRALFKKHLLLRFTSLTIAALYQSNYCGATKVGLTMVNDQGKFDRLFNNHSVLLGDDKRNEKSKLNSAKNHLLIAMGVQPSADYPLSLKQFHATISNDQLVIPLQEKRVSEGNLAAMVVTNPCMIISIKKAQYTSIKAGSYIKELP